MHWFQKLQTASEKLQAEYCRLFGRDYVCGCGHTAKWKTAMTIHGQGGVFKIPSKQPDYCPECWAKAAIKCAWCGQAILPGDPITLYSPGKSRQFLFASTKEPGEARKLREQENFVVPDHAVIYKQEPHLQLVGCLGWNCADTGGDRAGFWVMPGKVQRVATMEEIFLASGAEALFVNDLSDPNEAIPIDD